LPLTCSGLSLLVLLLKEDGICSFETSKPTISRKSKQIDFYQEQCTSADVYPSGGYSLGDSDED